MGYFSTTNFGLEIAKGNVPGHELVGIVSSNKAVGTTFTDLWGGGGNLVYPTVAETWEVASGGNVADTIAGTGAQKVTIITLDSSYNLQDPVTVDLAGVSSATFTGTHFRLVTALVTQVGTGAMNAGDITIRSTGGGTPNRGVIGTETTSLEGNMSVFNSQYTVPSGKTAFWVQSSGFSPKGEDVKLKPLFQIGGVGPFLAGGVSTTYQSQFTFPFRAPLKLPEKSEILFRSKSTASPTFFTGVMEFVLVDNDLVTEGTSTWNYQL